MAHRKLTKCHVLFLGNSVPEEFSKGLRALQQPLMKCYPVDHPNEVEGIDSWLTVFTSGILLQLVGSKGEQSPVIWFPIQNLFVAAATKCVNYVDAHGNRQETEFADMNSHAAKLSSHPPLFSIIVRKSEGKKILQCYTFLVKDEGPAQILVDAAKQAFMNKSGWTESAPPEKLIRDELVSTSLEADEIDEFDSVSTAGRQIPGRKMQNERPAFGDNSDSDGPYFAPDNQSMTFPPHLVKKYHLSYAKGPSRYPARQPMPESFMPHYATAAHGSSRSRGNDHHPKRSAMPSHFLNSGKGTVSSIRYDPKTRTSIIEKVVRQPVPVPVPIYQPQQPPKIIREVKPIYIPQPPEIRHVPVQVEKRVPVPIPVYMPYGEQEFGAHMPYGEQEFGAHMPTDSKHSHRSRSHKPHKSHHKFKSYQVFDDEFVKRGKDDSAFFINDGIEIPYPDYKDFYDQSNPGRYPYNRTNNAKEYRQRRRHSSSDSSDDGRRYKSAWENLNPYTYRSGGNRGVEITELSSPDESPRHEQRLDVNGNRRKHQHQHQHGVKELEVNTTDFYIREKPRSQEANYVQGEFHWYQASSAKHGKDKKKSQEDRRKEDVTMMMAGPSIDQREMTAGPMAAGPSHIYDYNKHGLSPKESKKERKDKKKKEKTPTGRISTFEADVSGNQEYFLKEHTEGPPRNWMDENKEYMNERAFSSSLAQDKAFDAPDAYALNHNEMNETIMDRQLPLDIPGVAAVSSNGIPVPPPLPADGNIPAAYKPIDATLY